jgi:hypothetical protein
MVKLMPGDVVRFSPLLGMPLEKSGGPRELLHTLIIERAG